MKPTPILRLVAALAASTLAATAADVYVVASANANAAAPYDTWETAISGIESAKAYADGLLAGGADRVTLHLATGTYRPRYRIMLTNAVHVIGHGADFDKVIIQIDNSGRANANKLGVFLMDHADAWLENVKVTGGDGRDYSGGSGIRLQGAGGTVTNCHITGNTAGGSNHKGGGISMFSSGALVTHCVINGNEGRGNNMQGFGGGVYSSAGTLANCLVTGNIAMNGGGIAIANTTTGMTRIFNCTVVGNTANYVSSTTGRGGGISFHGGAAEIVNSVFADNTSNAEASFTGKPDWCALVAIPAGTFSHCAFGNASGNPPDDDTCLSFAPSWADASYRLPPGSPLANQGTSYADMAPGDLDGNPRVAGAAVDIGCYEDQNTAFALDFVTSAAAVLEGSEVAFTARTSNEPEGEKTFTWTLSTPGAPDTVFTGRNAAYTFARPGHYDITLSADGAESVTKADALHVGARTNYLASVASGAVPALPYNTWATAATDINVVLAEAVSGATVLVGPGTYGTTNDVIISEAIALVSTDGYGATTIRNARGAPSGTTNRRTVTLNHPDARLEGFTIKDGYARGGSSGGGIYIDTQGGTVVACRVTGNHATGTNSDGGGVGCSSSSGLFERCIIDANDAKDAAGGVLLSKGAMRDCLVVSNTVENCVGGIYAESGATVANCTVVLNTQTKSSSASPEAPFGGIYAASGASVANCIAAGNTIAVSSAATGAPEAGGSAAAFSHCGVAAPAAAPGTAGISAANCGFADAANGNWRLLRDSDFYKKGVVQNWMSAAADLAGGARVTRAGRVDLGCFETPYVSPATILGLR